MTGSLQIKNGKYYMVLNRSVKGKRKQQWVSTGLPEKGNKRRAEQMLRETLAKESCASSLPQSDITVSECIRQWLESTKRRVDEVTYLGYLHTATAHILPYFDATGLKLQDCTTATLQAYFDEKHLHGRKDGKGGLSSKTTHHYSILQQSLAKAVKDGLLRSNPPRSGRTAPP